MRGDDMSRACYVTQSRSTGCSLYFFFSSRRRHTRYWRDWNSDVCSSDLDHPTFRSSARALLEAEGFKVIGEAEDGAAGVARARELSPDLVLLDVQLPDAEDRKSVV